jgi:hypothetical protein
MCSKHMFRKEISRITRSTDTSASELWHVSSVNVYNYHHPTYPFPNSCSALSALAVTARRLVTSSCYRRTREEEFKSAATHQRHQECRPQRQDRQSPLTENIGYCQSLLTSQHWLQACCRAKRGANTLQSKLFL